MFCASPSDGQTATLYDTLPYTLPLLKNKSSQWKISTLFTLICLWKGNDRVITKIIGFLEQMGHIMQTTFGFRIESLEYQLCISFKSNFKCSCKARWKNGILESCLRLCVLKFSMQKKETLFLFRSTQFNFNSSEGCNF